MKSSFDMGSEAWCSYDYHASIPLGANFFVMAPWERERRSQRLGVHLDQRDRVERRHAGAAGIGAAVPDLP